MTTLLRQAVPSIRGDAADVPLREVLARILGERLRHVPAGIEAQLPVHLRRWLDRSREYLDRNGDAHGGTSWAAWQGVRSRLQADVRFSVMLDALDAMLSALPDILAGRLSADSLLPAGFSLAHLVDDGDPDARDRCDQAVFTFVNDYIDERRRADPADRVRILDLGGGAPRLAAIEAVLRRADGRIAEYRFGGTADTAMAAAADDRGVFVASPIDVERPLPDQGIMAGRYDVLIASCALSGAGEVRGALRRAKAALKRHGILILHDIGAFDLAAHLTLGLTERWWRCADAGQRVEGSRALATESWLALLAGEGFGDAFPLEPQSAGLGHQVIVAESDGRFATHDEAAWSPQRTTEAAPAPSPGVRPRAGGVEDEGSRRQSGGPSAAELLQAVEQVVRKCLVEGLGLDPADVGNDRNFEEFGLESLAAVRIAKEIADALAIALPATLMFDHNSVEGLSRHILAAHADAVRARFVPEAAPTAAPAAPVAAVAPREEAGADAGMTLRRIVIDRPGRIEDMRIVSEPCGALGPRDVRVAVRAFALNFGDLLCVKGLYPTMPPYPFTPGMEISGVVEACGSDVVTVRPGDAVVAMTGPAFGGHATFVTCEAHQLWRKPDGLSFEEACSLPIAGITMLEAFRRAQLKRGERILIQTAAGGAGLVAVQLARHLGAEIFATAGTQEKIAFLAREGVDHCIHYIDSDFEAEIRHATGGRGVDVVINTLAGEAIQKGLRCLAPGGRYVELAMTGLKGARAIDLSVLDDNQVFHSLDLRKQVRAAPERMVDLYAELADWVDRGVIRPVVGAVVPFDAFDRAYRLIEERRNIGKIVVRVAATAGPPQAGETPVFAAPEAAPRSHDDTPFPREPIAVVGLSGRFPKSPDLDALWENLARGADLTGPVSRWALRTAEGASPGAWKGGFLDAIDRFDAAFFGITDLEALYMDPQQRVFLEEAWNALENAGYVGAGVDGRACGVYVGAASVDYATCFHGDAPPQAFWGNVGSIIPARIAYHLNLRGPAVAVDTACSSSLVAIHMACQSLWLGEVEMALAGGVFLQPGPSFFEQSIAANMLSPTGRCHAFDDRANGFVPGEGVGALVLKRLRDAIDDGDHIHGLIRGIGINQDGKTSGITAPSGYAQTLLQKRVHAEAGISSDAIQVVEAHGTGTKLGDPIEFRALCDAFDSGAAREARCAIGSIKTNLGHTVTAAGVAGVLKVLLAMRHRQIPPSLHFEAGNRDIDFENAPFFVNTTLRNWVAAPGQRRLAAVSSFGFSGTNAHAILEEAPPVQRIHAARPTYLVVLSARTAEQLRAQAVQLARWCIERPGIDLGDLSYTLSLGRQHFTHRLAVVVSDVRGLVGRLEGWLAAAPQPDLLHGAPAAMSAVERAHAADLGRRQVVQAKDARDALGWSDALRAIADLFVQGADIGFADLFADGGYGRIPLPTYPYARQSFWAGKPHADSPTPGEAAPTPGHVVAAPPSFARAGLRFCARDWTAAAIDPAAPVPALRRHWIFLDPAIAALQPSLSALLPDADVDLLPEGRGAADRLAAAMLAIVSRIDAGFKAKPASDLLVQVVGRAEQDMPQWQFALSALFRSAQLETPRLHGQVIALEGESGRTAAALAEILRDNRKALDDNEILYRADGERRIVRLAHDAAPPDPAHLPWKEGGVYLITGGGGALGRIFAREIAARCRRAAVILVGRSTPSPELERFLAELRAGDVSVAYRVADVGDHGAATALVADILRDHGTLDGILHAAAVTLDQFLIRKDSADFRKVLAPKADAAEHLDHATRDLPLDFFVLFSSLSAVFGNAGQSDYATANAFLDRFADHRARLTAEGKRCGRTVSINWPLWGEGGLGRNATLRAQFAEMGMAPLETGLGLRAFYAALAGGRSQTILVHGGVAGDISSERDAMVEPEVPARPGDRSNADRGAIEAALWNRLVALMRSVTFLAPERFDTDATFESFGIDSTMIVQVNAKLAKAFVGLPKTLLFEYATLRALRDYLLREHFDACVAWCDGAPAPQARALQVPESTVNFEVGKALKVSPSPQRAGAEPVAPPSIAIVGLAGVYPQAADPDQFWRNLAAGRDSITDIVAARWSAVYHCDDPDLARRSGRSYCRFGGFLDGFANFDPLFFNISPAEALSMDPQERLFLQECWHALEDAGYTREMLRERYGSNVGVFAGVSKTGYELYGPEMWRNGEEVHLRTSFASVANRVSYLLDLHGPSLAVDTMCSSSLTAIHQACESLQRRECAMALAGGVNLYLHPETYATLSAAGMLSRTGACRTFGAGADGFVPGEGVGAVLLKRLEDAVADGDPVHAVIRASAINHGGHTHGYTVPNVGAQRALIQATLAKAGVDARDIDYVEAHGTGTLLGDPIEVEALAKAFAADSQDRQYCALGSVKSNIGHLEAAAGIAGLTKVVLQMRHGMLAPSLHVDTLNGNIPFEQTPFTVQRALAPWPTPDGRGKERLACVSSFGAGGANAHLVVEAWSAPQRHRAPGPRVPAYILLSARNAERLRAYAARIARWLRAPRDGELDVQDLAHTLQLGREAMPCRLALEVRSIEELAQRLDRFVAGEAPGEGLYYADSTTAKSRLAATIGDADPGRVADALIADGNFSRLLELWTLGLAVDWSRGGYAAGARRISVPGYPFAEERYWPKAATSTPSASETPDTGIRLLTAVWDHQPASPTADVPDGPFLVLAGVDDETVPDPKSPGRLLRLARDASVDDYVVALSSCGSPVRILWYAPPGGEARVDDDRLLDAARACLRPLFRLMKALLQLGYGARPLELTVVTRMGVATHVAELADPSHAAVHGLIGALAKEYAHWRVRAVDLDDRTPSAPSTLLAMPVLPRGDVTAVRHDRWFRQRLVRSTARTQEAPSYRHGGVYVVLGGAGYLGRVLSEQLVRDHQAQVVWIGRRAMDDTIREAIEQLAELGPRPLYLRADATDRAALQDAVQRIVKSCGPINGIVHSTMVLDDVSIAGMDETRLLAVLAAKADVCVRMAQAFGAQPLDFVMFFSSLQSFGRLAGQGNYAAACLFADAFAHRLRAAWGVPVKIINWGSWDIVGGQAASATVTANMENAGVGVLSPRDAAAGVGLLLAGPFDQFGYFRSAEARADEAAVASSAPPPAPPAPADAAPDATAGQRARHADDPIPAADVRRHVRNSLVDALRQALNLTSQPIDGDDPLAAYGLDSITGLNFIALVNAALDIELDILTIYDHPTIAALSEHIVARFGDTQWVARARTDASAAPAALPIAPEAHSGESPLRPVPASAPPEGIAVVGLAGRYPDAPDAKALWERLLDGADLVGETTRWADLAGAFAEEGGQFARHGGFLEDIDAFDPLFFGISKAEARYMDPQQRIFLEEAWHALEDAGYAGASMRGQRCGIYVGHNRSDYHRLFTGEVPPQALWGNAPSVVSARISYHLDLQGPALTVDTACSSSLVAIHLACQALKSGEVDMALAGGVQIFCTPAFHAAAGASGMLSPSGRCHTFDARADGFVAAEGAGAVVLKRLGDALASRDHIYGVILGSATNQDGATNGITAPSGPAQERLQRQAYEQAGVRPRDIGLVEAHGTGTKLGDPIEFGALANVFREDTAATGFCALGSVKANIGHTLAASGVAGVLKALLALRHAQIPPSIHFETCNPRIDVEKSPFFIPRQVRPWPRGEERPRLAAVSSFGFSGTNAHVILGEAPPAPARSPRRAYHLIVLSAKGMEELRHLGERLRAYCKTAACDCGDLSFTLAVGRQHFAHRIALVVRDVSALGDALSEWLDRGSVTDGFVASLRERDIKERADADLVASDAVRACRESAEEDVLRDALLRLAQLHVEGHSLPFEALFAGGDYGRISLPGYPFRRERCWVGQASPARHVPEAVAASGPSPDSGDGYRLLVTLNADDPRLQAHRQAGRPTVPGVTCLELAREAAARLPAFQTGVDLVDIAWLRPLFVDETGVSLAIDLRPGESGWTFEIRRAVPDSALYCRGTARPALAEEARPAARDFAEARQGERTTLARDRAYTLLDAAGIAIPADVRHIEAIEIGRARILVRLGELPPSTVLPPDAALHPAALEAALQGWAAAKLAEGRTSPAGGAFPFALGAAIAGTPLRSVAWAAIRDSEASGSGATALDIDFYDEAGVQGVRFRRLTLRAGSSREADAPLRASKPPSAVSEEVRAREPASTVSTLISQWMRADGISAVEPGDDGATMIFAGSPQAAAWCRQDLEAAGSMVLSADTTIDAIAAALRNAGAIRRIVCCFVDDAQDPRRPEDRPALHFFRLLKALMLGGRGTQRIEVVIVTQNGVAVRSGDIAVADQAAVHGVAGVLAKEMPDWAITVADIASTDSIRLPEILCLPPDPAGNVLAFRQGVWLRQGFVHREVEESADRGFRHGGVYVVLGGAGALGEVLSEHLIRAFAARIIWVGRRPLDTEIQRKIDRLGAFGTAPLYLSADARDRADFRRVLDTVMQRHRFIDGLVHSALLLSGSDIAHMSETQFADVFSAKADICDNIAEFCAPGSIGLVLFFSSLQALQKTPRQANYAAGCAYKDAAAERVAARLGCPVKTVNWGYWGSVGQAATLPAFQNWLKQAGMGSIEPAEGMAFLERLLASPIRQAAYATFSQGAELPGITIIGDETVADVSKHNAAFLFSSGTAPEERAAAILAETARYPTQAFEAIVGRLLCTQMQSLGLFDQPWIDPARWVGTAGILDLYRPWVEETLRILAGLGHLQRDGDGYRPAAFEASVPPAALWSRWEEAKAGWQHFPQMEALTRLIEATLRRLPEIVTGRVAATEILFPGSSLRLVEPLYKNNPIADYFNQAAADSLVAFLRARIERDPGARIRILEVGAGTGGTTSVLIDRLRPYARYIEDYRYTDLSKVFLAHAKAEYAPHAPYLSCAIFDVENAPEDQSMPQGHFDVVVAANVLHATRNMRRTLANVRACLKPDGMLLLNELSEKGIFSHLTFGLLKGWWLSEDLDLRVEGSPVIAQETWRSILCETGFATVRFPTAETAHLGQQIVVAQCLETRVGDTPAPEAVAAPAVSLRPAEDAIRQAVLDEVSQALEVEPSRIDPDISFADYGVDSLIAVATVDRLNARLGAELTSTSLFEHSSVNLLVAHIATAVQIRAAVSEDRASAPPVVPAVTAKLPVGHEAPPPQIDPAADRAASATARAPDVASARDPSVPIYGQPSSPEPIAIVGASGRFGSADTLAELWQTLATGAERVAPVTRWDLADCYGVPQGSEGYCWRGGLLNDIDCFDPAFFNISGIEATYMDPQQRLFLEEAWKALEDGGYAGAAIEGRRCGVYVGHNGDDYRGLCSGNVPPQAMWGIAGAVLSARISYFLNLKGPAITIDTACSSSLVAVHQACQSLRLREVDVALAGGVSVRCTSEFYKATAVAGMLSPSGRCYAFDERADGFVPGEGVGVVLLKRLSDALADGDQIHAVIRGSCLNQDGTTNGITAPNAASQEQLELEVYALTGTHPEEIQLVEAHGTGTKLGDPIEHEALTRAFRKHTQKQGFCALGSIKANIGHATAAAGIASIMKVLLAMRHAKIPPTPNYRAPNPLLAMEESPFYVNADLRDWPALPDGRRCAAISSFGISGTNAHLILEAGPKQERHPVPAPGYLVVLSAQTVAQVRGLLDRLLSECEQNPGLDCGDVSFTLLTGRRHLRHRIALVVRDLADLVETGRRYLQGGTAPSVYGPTAAMPQVGSRSLMTDFGNRCIRECAEGASGEAYLTRLQAVAELFVQGHALAFADLFAHRDVQRVSLPGYPFARERYWVGGGVAGGSRPVEAASAAMPSANPQPAAASKEARALVVGLPPDDRGAQDEVFATISRFIVEELRVPEEKIQDAEDIQTYGMDSLMSMRLARRLEEDFRIALSGSDALQCRTLGELTRLVAERIDASSSPAVAESPSDDPAMGEAEHRAIEVLDRFNRGDLDLDQTEAMLREIALP